ncbi:hypothetical protein BDV27DRAFT_152803 [Aspergillus caelatus]|uniref:Restriction endonuclease type IV Mrr domain-containing protein n=1 Tax=Aspergillus caelatus TaxID=61420 RepID=A0A5N7AIM1_9EURO|nr:uncharacterized protein BDV27DRAFT_152803 [Aspergillus caelatus]KAE8369722.1 hypothetical protein BDV27DRAFT_152803 [Aspergillus caelatus]
MAAFIPSLQNNIGFRRTLQLVEPHSLEDTVQQLWQAIVSSWFPSNEGYMWSIKGSALTQDDIPNITVIQVKELAQDPEASGGWSERLILLVECKRPSSGIPVAWDNTISAQCQNDLSQTNNESGKLFRVVAIGRRARFYQFNGEVLPDQQLVQLHKGTFDVSDPAGIAQVESMMNYIKANS